MKIKIIQATLAIASILASFSIIYFAIKHNPLNDGWADSLLGFGFYTAYALLALAILTLMVFSMWSFIHNFKESKRALLGVGALAIIFLISHIISSPTSSKIEQKFEVSDSLSKFIGSSLIISYIFLGGAILAAVWLSLSSRFK